MRSIHIVAMLLVSLLLFSGCGATLNNVLGIPNSPQEFIASQDDKELATAYADWYNSRTYDLRKNKWGFTIGSVLVAFDDYDQHEAINNKKNAQYNVTAKKLDDDEIAKRYKAAVLKRGNKYTVYKNDITEMAYEAVVGGAMAKRDFDKQLIFNWTPAIFEYDGEGRLKSVLLRMISITDHPLAKGEPLAPVKIEMSSDIFYGSAAYRVENKLNNRTLQEYTLYSSKANSSDKASVSTNSKVEELKALYELQTSGALSKEEYEREKAKLLNQSPEPKQTQKSSSMQDMVIQNYNEKHGTNYTSMQEIFNTKVGK